MKEYKEVLEHAGVNIEMVPIKGGKFLMGSSKTEEERKEDEGPQHEVEIAPLLDGEVRADLGSLRRLGRGDRHPPPQVHQAPALASRRRRRCGDPTDRALHRHELQHGEGPPHPAICMTQHAARTYCKWLSAKTGRYYRLPTEAEWSTPAAPGPTTAYSFGNDPDKPSTTTPGRTATAAASTPRVGLKKPNPWGLYDMHGNVAEWVLDQYIPDVLRRRPASPDTVVQNPLAIPKTVYPRVVRGGGWDHEPADLRAAARMASAEEWSDRDPQNPRSIWYHTDALSVGIRVVRPLGRALRRREGRQVGADRAGAEGPAGVTAGRGMRVRRRESPFSAPKDIAPPLALALRPFSSYLQPR